jgi:hypothetical protein
MIEIVRRVPAAAEALVAAGVDPVLARVFAARGIGSAASIAPTMEALPRPGRCSTPAPPRLARPSRQQRIVIVADYDADGATAVAGACPSLVRRGCRHKSSPAAFEHGYGLTPEIVALAAAPRLIVTVDNIAGVDGVWRRRTGNRRADHRSPPARRAAAGAGDHRQSKPARLRLRVEAHRGRRLSCSTCSSPRARLREEGFFRGRETPNPVRCSISLRSAPWPTWSGSTT